MSAPISKDLTDATIKDALIEALVDSGVDEASLRQVEQKIKELSTRLVDELQDTTIPEVQERFMEPPTPPKDMDRKESQTDPALLSEKLRRDENEARRANQVQSQQGGVAALMRNNLGTPVDANRLPNSRDINQPEDETIEAQEEISTASQMRQLEQHRTTLTRAKPKYVQAKKNIQKQIAPLVQAEKKLTQFLRLLQLGRIVLCVVAVVLMITIIFSEIALGLFSYVAKITTLIKEVKMNRKEIQKKLEKPRKQLKQAEQKIAKTDAEIRQISAYQRSLQEEQALRSMLAQPT